MVTGADARGFKMPSDMIQVTTFGSTSRGYIYERYQQMFGPAEVAGAQISVQRDGTGDVTSVGGKHFDAIVPTNAVTLSNADAIAIAATALPDASERTAVLRIDPTEGRYYYAVDSRGDALRHMHWVDAETGAIFNDFNTLTSGCSSTPGGVGILGEQYDLAGKVKGGDGTKYTLDSGRQVTRDLGSQKKPFYGTADQDADGCYDNASRTSPGQLGLVSAHVNVMVADQYYLSTYGFDLASHTGGIVTVWAHKDVNYNNAFWDGTKMVFGDGDGVSYRNFAADDVSAHEITHGITEFTSNLEYQGESGALNEAFSDIMGYTIGDPDDWKMGEDVTLDGQGFRNMADPSLFNDPMDYCTRYTGTSDYGGVHTNSAIANRAFYLAATAMTSPTDGVTEPAPILGAVKAADIFFKAFTHLPTQATFADARVATVAKAGEADPEGTLGYAAAVAAAWDGVKVAAPGAPSLCTTAPPGCTSNSECADDTDPCTSAVCNAGTCGQADNGTCGASCTASNGACSSNADCCSNSCRTGGKKKNTCT